MCRILRLGEKGSHRAVGERASEGPLLFRSCIISIRKLHWIAHALASGPTVCFNYTFFGGTNMTTSKKDDNAPLKSDKPSWDFRFAEALCPGVRYRVRAISPDGVTFDFDVTTDGNLSNLYSKSAGRSKQGLRRPPDELVEQLKEEIARLSCGLEI